MEILNWSKNVYNLLTKRAVAYQNASVEWIDCNVGSQVTMKYPSVINIVSWQNAGDIVLF